MALRFCQRCKTIQAPHKNNFGFFKCEKCGFVEEIKNNDSLVSSEKMISAKEVGKGVAGEENMFATYENKCKKCGFDKAQIIDVGLFYSDEDHLIMVKCGKCGHSERLGKAG